MSETAVMKVIRIVGQRASRLALGFALAALCMAVQAQDARATGKTSVLGAGTAKGGKILTRDELRACMRRQEEVNADRGEIERLQAQLADERAELERSGQALTAAREEVSRLQTRVRAFDDRVREQNQAIADWNTRAAEFEKRRGEERLRRQLDRDRVALEARGEALTAERNVEVRAYETAVNDFNSRAQARDARAADWNQRNVEATQAATAVARAREQWADECAGRRYREDDELAIKAGK